MADSEQNRNNCDDVKYLGKADKPTMMKMSII